jgi:hypothetical protein
LRGTPARPERNRDQQQSQLQSDTAGEYPAGISSGAISFSVHALKKRSQRSDVPAALPSGVRFTRLFLIAKIVGNQRTSNLPQMSVRLLQLCRLIVVIYRRLSLGV